MLQIYAHVDMQHLLPYTHTHCAAVDMHVGPIHCSDNVIFFTAPLKKVQNHNKHIARGL